MNPSHRTTALAALLVAASTPPVANAARSYDNCTGFIDTAPVIITTQGTWCLRKDVATNLGSGEAISVVVANVTIDCNDFKLGNLAAGPTSTARGVTTTRDNLTVRNCALRGYHHGVDIAGSGALVEDNRFDGSLSRGIRVDGAGTVRRNRVFETVAPVTGGDAVGIEVIGDVHVLDNEVHTVVATVGAAFPVAHAHTIWARDQTFGLIARNLVQDTDVIVLTGWSTYYHAAILVEGTQTRIIDNVLPAAYISCSTAVPRARGNTTLGVLTCTDDGNHY